jgi:hypothetical protein
MLRQKIVFKRFQIYCVNEGAKSAELVEAIDKKTAIDMYEEYHKREHPRCDRSSTRSREIKIDRVLALSLG